MMEKRLAKIKEESRMKARYIRMMILMDKLETSAKQTKDLIQELDKFLGDEEDLSTTAEKNLFLLAKEIDNILPDGYDL